MARIVGAHKAREALKEEKTPDMRGIGMVEYSLSAQQRVAGRGEVWVKVGCSVAVQPDETGQDALDRAVIFVTENLETQIKELR